jgi:hypothetical protein
MPKLSWSSSFFEWNQICYWNSYSDLARTGYKYAYWMNRRPAIKLAVSVDVYPIVGTCVAHCKRLLSLIKHSIACPLIRGHRPLCMRAHTWNSGLISVSSQSEKLMGQFCSIFYALLLPFGTLYLAESFWPDEFNRICEYIYSVQLTTTNLVAIMQQILVAAR